MGIHILRTKKLAELVALYGQMKIDYDLVKIVLARIEKGEPLLSTLHEEAVNAAKRLNYDKKDALAYEFNRKAPKSLKNSLGFNLDTILEGCTRVSSYHPNIQ